ncbi:MAG: hypothetical protein ABIQ09_06785 [Jatrophihabitantaceae bacterium]
MAASPVDVIGSTPVSFTNAEGAQKVVPLSAPQFTLSALQFNGSELQVRSACAVALSGQRLPLARTAAPTASSLLFQRNRNPVPNESSGSRLNVAVPVW